MKIASILKIVTPKKIEMDVSLENLIKKREDSTMDNKKFVRTIVIIICAMLIALFGFVTGGLVMADIASKNRSVPTTTEEHTTIMTTVKQYVPPNYKKTSDYLYLDVTTYTTKNMKTQKVSKEIKTTEKKTTTVESTTVLEATTSLPKETTTETDIIIEETTMSEEEKQ